MDPDVVRFNRSRVEGWQWRIGTGDYFCAIFGRELVCYGRVIGYETAPVFRLVHLYSDFAPDGVDEVLDVRHLDFPLTYAQFDTARDLGWPSALGSVAMIVHLSPSGAS